MNTERLQSPSPVFQNGVFFTQENYKKYSYLPSFGEFLEKHLSSAKDGDRQGQNIHDSVGEVCQGNTASKGNNVNKAANSGIERCGSYSTLACLGPEMEFPFVSKISIESQRMFLETFEMIKAGELAKVDLQKMKTVQEIKKEVLAEQEEFQKFVFHHAKSNHHLYNFIHPDVCDNFKIEIERKLKESVEKYPQHYCLHETVGLTVGAVFKSDAVLTFEQTVLQVGNVPRLTLPETTGIMLSEFSAVAAKETDDQITTAGKSKVVSEDPVAVSLAMKHEVDIVISSSGLNTLLDNQPPGYRKQWILPITVQRQQENGVQSIGHKVVFIDKPLPPRSVSPRTVNWKFYKGALRRLVCQNKCFENSVRDDGNERSSCSDVKLGTGTAMEGLYPSSLESRVCDTDKVSNKKLTSTDISDSESRKRQAVESENEVREVKKSKMADSNPKANTVEKENVSSDTNKGNKFFVYNLWRFGKLKILIRCSVDAYRTDSEKPNSFTFLSVLPKLEYQPTFGHEKLTCSETARLWLHGYIRPKTNLICGRINVFNSELLRVDELSVSDVLQQGTSFNPAQGMKVVFQVFQALKRLPEGKFILSHKSGEMHGCLYKSVGVSNSGAALKSSFDLHKVKTPVISNYTETEIPWVVIDCNLFLPWQIRDKRIPCTFPAVPAKDLETMAQKDQQTKGKKSKKKKKGKKMNKGKVTGFAPKNPNPEPATEQSAKVDQERRKSLDRTFPEQKHQDRKSMDKGKLFARFYNTQPVEKESEVFAVAKRASGPITYDDIDF